MITIANSNPLADSLEPWFKKLPNLPSNIVDILYTLAPWLALIFGVLGVIGALAAFSAFSFLAPYAFMGGAANSYGAGMIATLGALIVGILMVVAFSGLRAGKLAGWTLLFWSEVVSVLVAILGIFGGSISLGSIIGALIGFYLLFQIKPRYH